MTSACAIIIGDCLNVAKAITPGSMHAIVTDPPGGLGMAVWDAMDRATFVPWLRDRLAAWLPSLRVDGVAAIWAPAKRSHWTGWAIEEAGFEVMDRLSHLTAYRAPKTPQQLKPGAEDWFFCQRRGDSAALYTELAKLPSGRHPSNVILDEEAAAMLDAVNPKSKSRKGKPRASKKPGNGWGMTKTGAEYDDEGGPSRFFRVITCGDESLAEENLFAGRSTESINGKEPVDGSGTCPICNAYLPQSTMTCTAGCGKIIESFEEWNSVVASAAEGIKRSTNSTDVQLVHVTVTVKHAAGDTCNSGVRLTESTAEPTCEPTCKHTDAESVGNELKRDPATRFFFTSRVTRAEKNAGLDTPNDHMTVKSIALMRYILRLAAGTSPSGYGPIIADPFCGTGTTGCAAVLEGFRFLGVDTDARSAVMAVRRIHATNPSTPQKMLNAAIDELKDLFP